MKKRLTARHWLSLSAAIPNSSDCYKFGIAVGDAVGDGRGDGQSRPHSGVGIGRGVGVGLACAEITAVMLIAAMNNSKQRINLIPAAIYTAIGMMGVKPNRGQHPIALFFTVEQPDNFLDRPNVIGDSGFHCGRDTKRGVNAGKVVMHIMNCDCVLVVFKLF